MREDMSRVTVERPRLGGDRRRKGRTVSLDDLPKQEGMRRRHLFAGPQDAERDLVAAATLSGASGRSRLGQGLFRDRPAFADGQHRPAACPRSPFGFLRRSSRAGGPEPSIYWAAARNSTTGSGSNRCISIPRIGCSGERHGAVRALRLGHHQRGEAALGAQAVPPRGGGQAGDGAGPRHDGTLVARGADLSDDRNHDHDKTERPAERNGGIHKTARPRKVAVLKPSNNSTRPVPYKPAVHVAQFSARFGPRSAPPSTAPALPPRGCRQRRPT
jgi:hypothetical protein